MNIPHRMAFAKEQYYRMQKYLLSQFWFCMFWGERGGSSLCNGKNACAQKLIVLNQVIFSLSNGVSEESVLDQLLFTIYTTLLFIIQDIKARLFNF